MGKTIYEKIKAKKGLLQMSDNPYDTSGPNAFDAVSQGAAAASSNKETYVMAPGPGANNNDNDNNQIGPKDEEETDVSSALKQRCPEGQEIRNIDGVAHCVKKTETPGTPATPGEPNENVEIYSRACGGKNDGSIGTDPVTGQTRKCTQSGEPDPPSNQGTPGTGGQRTVSATPIEVENPESQQYNMGYSQATNANWARGAMRRGLNRDERKNIKNTVQKMRTLNPDAAEKYKDSMKKSRKGTFLGLGIGGDRQERKIQALKDANMIPQDYKSIKSEIAEKSFDMSDEERAQKIESATMNKYNIPINKYGDYKPASSEPMSGEGYEKMERSEVGTFDTPVPTSSEVGEAAGSNIDIVGASGLGSAVVVEDPNKKNSATKMLGAKQKPYKAKGALTYKAKFGRGPGYKS
tara:strand:+ start:163 stop:1386 length:1224 start_codon:yes stop_codon:yes gene_type:complete